MGDFGKLVSGFLPFLETFECLIRLANNVSKNDDHLNYFVKPHSNDCNFDEEEDIDEEYQASNRKQEEEDENVEGYCFAGVAVAQTRFH